MDKFETAKQFFFEGLRLLEANNYQGAERQFTRSLDLVPDRVSTLNNLSTVKIRLNKFAEAEALALKAVAVAETSPEAWSNLGIALAAAGRREEALQACERALQCNCAYAMAWLIKSTTLLELRRFDEALVACEQALKLEPDKCEFLHAQSLILKELHRVQEAREIYQRALDLRLAKTPVLSGERCATQKAEILITSRNPDFDDSFSSFEKMLRFCENFPGQLANHLLEDFHFTYVFMGAAGLPHARTHIGQPDLVINNYVNGELIQSRGILPRLSEWVDSFNAPVVNHPTKAVQTTRDVSVKLLEHLPGVLVPKTMRFSSAGKSREDLVREIEDHYDYPLITRSVAMQRGIGMTKVDSREALLAALAGDLPATFFVTQFVDSRGGAKLFRKLRAAVVGDEIVLVRVDYNGDWNVHGPRRTEEGVAFCLANGHLFEEEKRICKDPEAYLGHPALQALQAVRKRIPLDVFGIDFDVDADGILIFYEANATMNLFCTRRKEVPYVKEAQDHLKEAFRSYFTALTSRTRQAC